MRRYLLFLLLFVYFHSFAQKIYGTVFTDKGDLLPYSSITIKGTTIGASANANAKFSVTLVAGTYTVVCQHIGYAAQEKKVIVNGNDEEIVFVLNE